MNTFSLRPFFIFLAVISLIGCADTEDPNSDYLITISTEHGDMKVILFEETPAHKENFVKLAKAGMYDGTIWHRVINDFMIQGGDIYGGGLEPEDGRLPAEIVPGFWHVRGALAAARQSDVINPERKSSGCQFYIVDGQDYKTITTDYNLLYQKFNEMIQNNGEKYSDLLAGYRTAATEKGPDEAYKYIRDNKDFIEKEMGIEIYKPLDRGRDGSYKESNGGVPFLDGQYTVFGKVVEGMEVIDKIASVQTGIVDNQKDRPYDDLTIKMEVNRIPKTEITEKYGYKYPTE